MRPLMLSYIKGESDIMKENEAMNYPLALTVAGSDSGGGAGIQADLRTFAAFGVFGTSAITAVTAQNPCEVTAIEGLKPETVAAQIRAVASKLAIGGIKTGMMFSAEIVAAAAKELAKRKAQLVVDPVMVATSGAVLLKPDAIENMQKLLLPLADWITPNIPEAELLLGRKLEGAGDFAAAAAELSELYGAGVILKTGHAAAIGREAVDFVALEDGVYELGSPRITLEHPSAAHGTGCTFSAALAAAFALEMEPDEALRAAKGFVLGSLTEAVEIGSGLLGMYPPQDSYENKTFLRRRKR